VAGFCASRRWGGDVPGNLTPAGVYLLSCCLQESNGPRCFGVLLATAGRATRTTALALALAQGQPQVRARDRPHPSRAMARCSTVPSATTPSPSRPTSAFTCSGISAPRRVSRRAVSRAAGADSCGAVTWADTGGTSTQVALPAPPPPYHPPFFHMQCCRYCAAVSGLD
jgi:hypothetical protein